MKLYIKLAFCGLLFLSSCAPNDYQGDVMDITKYPRNLSVDASKIELGAIDNRSASFNIKSFDTSWEIIGGPSWLSMGSTKGDVSEEIKIVAEENNSVYENRVATIVIKSTEYDYAHSETISVLQNSRTLATNVNEISFLSNGGTLGAFIIQADGNYSIKKGIKDSWYTLEHDASAKTFSVTASETTSGMRKGEIILSLENLPNGEVFSITIPVSQYVDGINVGIEDYDDNEQDWSDL